MLGWAAKNVPIGRLERTSGVRRISQPKYKIDRIAIGIRGQQKKSRFMDGGDSLRVASQALRNEKAEPKLR